VSAELTCTEAEDLLSEHYEGVLEEPLRRELTRHLASCTRCLELLAALGEVVVALRSAPELEPAADLADRAAAAALREAQAARPAPLALLKRHLPGLRLAQRARGVLGPSSPALVRGLAAALAILTTAVVLLAQAIIGEPARAANRVIERTVNAGVYLAERKDRLLEDFRILRVVIATAFEGRIDRVNDRVDDYKRLLERRRAAPSNSAPPPDASASPRGSGQEPRDASRGAAPDAQFLNFRFAQAVERSMTREAFGRTSRLAGARARRTV
jgi:anti-sigma factor RsiW